MFKKMINPMSRLTLKKVKNYLIRKPDVLSFIEAVDDEDVQSIDVDPEQ